ncbi:MAG: thioredoxin family protein [Ferruginibacter sp.]|nr:thioredoxin family protein [Ferruginibacter sp.]
MIKALFTLLFIFNTFLLSAQAEYETSKDSQDPYAKILRGTINKYLVQNDTAFKWYAPNQQSYHPDSAVINALAKVKSEKLQLVIFGGTWCEDTQFILPKLFKLQEMSGVPDENITFFGVNRKKLALGHIAEALGITNVPTIIVLKNGKELGRVVEYGKTGKWDQELSEIINKN